MTYRTLYMSVTFLIIGLVLIRNDSDTFVVHCGASGNTGVAECDNLFGPQKHCSITSKGQGGFAIESDYLKIPL
jgi:hypothetical protein